MSRMRLYAVRHGRSTGNDQRIFQGRRDLPLCALGQAQADACGAWLKDIHFDAAFVSPLSRARQTLAHILEGRDIPVIEDDRLTEMDVGLWSGHPFSWIVQNDPEGARCWNERPDEHAFPGGESMRDAYARINEAADDIAARYPDGTVLMVTHGGVLRCLWARIAAGSLRAVRDGAVFHNASVSVFSCENGVWRVESVNDTSFMPEALRARQVTYRL